MSVYMLSICWLNEHEAALDIYHDFQTCYILGEEGGKAFLKRAGAEHTDYPTLLFIS